MAILHVTEYSHLAVDSGGHGIQAGMEPALERQQVTFTTTNESAAFKNDTSFVRVMSDTDAYITFGIGTVTATTLTDTLIKANVAEFFGVKSGLSYKIAAVT